MKVFLSTSGTTLTIAEKIVEELQSLGHEVFYYRKGDILVGERWPEKISDELKLAEKIVCLISEGYINSQVSMDELHVAYIDNKLFLVRLDQSQIPALYMSIEYLDLSQQFSQQEIDAAVTQFSLAFARHLGDEERVEEIQQKIHQAISGDSKSEADPAMDIKEADEGEVLVIITNFKTDDSQTHEVSSWSVKLTHEMSDFISKRNVRLEWLPETVTTTKRAKEILELYDASIIVWGRKGYDYIVVNYETNFTFIDLLNYRRTSRFQEEIDILKGVVTSDSYELFINSGGEIQYVLMVLAGLIALESEKNQDAIEIFSEGISLIQSDPEKSKYLIAMYAYRAMAYQRIGELYSMEGDISAARQIEKQSGSEKYSVLRLLSGFENKLHVEEAQSHIETLTSLIQKNPDDIALLAILYSVRSELNASIRNDMVAIEDSYHSSGFLQDAVDLGLVQNSDASQKLFITLSVTRGESNVRLSNYDQAVNEFTRALDLATGTTLVSEEFIIHLLERRATLFKHMGETDKAISDYTAAIEIQPESFMLHVTRAIAYADVGEQEKSRQDIERAREIDPDRIKKFENLI